MGSWQNEFLVAVSWLTFQRSRPRIIRTVSNTLDPFEKRACDLTHLYVLKIRHFCLLQHVRSQPQAYLTLK